MYSVSTPEQVDLKKTFIYQQSSYLLGTIKVSLKKNLYLKRISTTDLHILRENLYMRRI